MASIKSEHLFWDALPSLFARARLPASPEIQAAFTANRTWLLSQPTPPSPSTLNP